MRAPSGKRLCTCASCRSSNASADVVAVGIGELGEPDDVGEDDRAVFVHSVSLTCWTIRIVPLTVLTSISPSDPSIALAAHVSADRLQSRRRRAVFGHRHLDRARDGADRDPPFAGRADLDRCRSRSSRRRHRSRSTLILPETPATDALAALPTSTLPLVTTTRQSPAHSPTLTSPDAVRAST